MEGYKTRHTGGEAHVCRALRYVLCIIQCAFLLSCVLGAEGVWHAFWVTELLTSVFAYIYYKRLSV